MGTSDREPLAPQRQLGGDGSAFQAWSGHAHAGVPDSSGPSARPGASDRPDARTTTSDEAFAPTGPGPAQSTWPVYPPVMGSVSESPASLEPAMARPVGPPVSMPPVREKKHWMAAVAAGVCAVVLVIGVGLGLVSRVTDHSGGYDPQPIPGMYEGDQEYADDGYDDGYYPADPNEAVGAVQVTAAGRPLTTGLIVTAGGGVASIVVPYHAVLGKTGLEVEQTSEAGMFQSPVEIAGFDVTKDLAVLHASQWAGQARAPLSGSSSRANDPTVVSCLRGAGETVEMNGYFSGTSWSDYAEITLESEESPDERGYLGMVRGLMGVTVGTAAEEGVVFDEDGEAIGIVVRAIPTSGHNSHGTDLYAVPMEDVRAFVAMVEAGKDSGSVRVGPAGDLGLTQVWQSATAQDFVIVTSVTPGGSAEQAGITVGDTLESIDGISVDGVQGAEVGPDGIIRMLEPGSVVTVEWSSAGGGPFKTAQLTVMPAS